jgi:lipocalin
VQKIIDQLAISPDMRRRLAEDPLSIARAEGYPVSDEDVRLLLGLDGSTGQDVREVLRLHLSRFDQGKWYQIERSPESSG